MFEPCFTLFVSFFSHESWIIFLSPFKFSRINSFQLFFVLTNFLIFLVFLRSALLKVFMYVKQFKVSNFIKKMLLPMVHENCPKCILIHIFSIYFILFFFFLFFLFIIIFFFDVDWSFTEFITIIHACVLTQLGTTNWSWINCKITGSWRCCFPSCNCWASSSQIP